MANVNFFRVMQNFTTNDGGSSPILTCGLQLANFNLDPVSHKDYNNFRSYGKSYFNNLALGFKDNGDGNATHFLYTSWYPTGSAAQTNQMIYQFQSSQTSETPPDLSTFTPFTSSINGTSSFSLPTNIMGSGMSPAFLAINSIQVPHTGSKVLFHAQSSNKCFIVEYNLDTAYDITSLDTASRKTREIAKLTGSSIQTDQISFGYTGSHLYVVNANLNGNTFPYDHWRTLTIFHLATPYDLFSSTFTSSFNISDELSLNPVDTLSTNNVNVSTLLKGEDYNFTAHTSSFFYTDSNTEKVYTFRIDFNHNIHDKDELDLGAFPQGISYSSPRQYYNFTSYKFENMFISNSLAPFAQTTNVNRTGSCLASYVTQSGQIPV